MDASLPTALNVTCILDYSKISKKLMICSHLLTCSVYDHSAVSLAAQSSSAQTYSNHFSNSSNVSSSIPLSALPSNLSPCPSFNSLSHSYFNSVLPPPKVADDDSQRYVLFVIQLLIMTNLTSLTVHRL